MSKTQQHSAWFRRKHFLVIGAAIKAYTLALPAEDMDWMSGVVADLVNVLADVFEKDNPEFRRQAFIDDCLALKE